MKGYILDYIFYKIIGLIIGIGVVRYLIMYKELTSLYILKLCIQILVVLGLSVFISFFITHNIYVVLMPLWLLLVYWSVCGYIEIFKTIKSFIIYLKNK